MNLAHRRRLKNSKALRFGIFAVLAILCFPVAVAASSSHGTGAMALAGLPVMGFMRMEKADDPAAPDAVGIPDAIKAIEDKTLPMSQRLGVALKALQGIDPTNQLATVKGDLDKAKADLAAKDGELTKAKADLEASNKRISALETDVKNADEARASAEKESADLRAKEQDLDKRAEAKAKEKVAALGFPASKLPAATDKTPGAAATDEDIMKMQAAADKESDPVAKHKLTAAILKAMEARFAGAN